MDGDTSLSSKVGMYRMASLESTDCENEDREEGIDEDDDEETGVVLTRPREERRVNMDDRRAV